MEESGSLGGGASKITYFLHPCLHCSRILYLVLDAVNICGGCFKDTITKRAQPDDGKDEEEED